MNSRMPWDCAVIQGRLRRCFAGPTDWRGPAIYGPFCCTMIPGNDNNSPQVKSNVWNGLCLKFSAWFHELGRLGRPSSRDTRGPVREAGVRHRKYARLSLARTRAPASSRTRRSRCCIESSQEGVLSSPRRGPGTGSLIDMSIVNFLLSGSHVVPQPLLGAVAGGARSNLDVCAPAVPAWGFPLLLSFFSQSPSRVSGLEGGPFAPGLVLSFLISVLAVY